MELQTWDERYEAVTQLPERPQESGQKSMIYQALQEWTLKGTENQEHLPLSSKDFGSAIAHALCGGT